MNIKDLIVELLRKESVTKSSFARRLGITRQALNVRLTKGNPSVDLACEMLDVLDYKIVVMPKAGRLPKDSYEVTVEEEE